MTRQLLVLVSSVLSCVALTAWPCLVAADELPGRKAGLWEMKIVKTGSSLPDMAMQHCTDASTDKDMANSFSPMVKQVCSKQDIQKTATGFVTDSVCSVAGVSVA